MWVASLVTRINKVAMGGLLVRRSFYLRVNLYGKYITGQLHDVLACSLVFLLLLTAWIRALLLILATFREKRPLKSEI